MEVSQSVWESCSHAALLLVNKLSQVSSLNLPSHRLCHCTMLRLDYVINHDKQKSLVRFRWIVTGRGTLVNLISENWKTQTWLLLRLPKENDQAVVPGVKTKETHSELLAGWTTAYRGLPVGCRGKGTLELFKDYYGTVRMCETSYGMFERTKG